MYRSVAEAISCYTSLNYESVVLIGKGDPYVKLTVDGKQPSKKTEAVRKTWEPKWDDEFTV